MIQMMRKLMKNGGVDRCEEAYDEHQVICGRTANKLDAEELEIYRFMIGGMQSK
jgi:5,10-methenyltetrahydromethanopterin hydrogenase